MNSTRDRFEEFQNKLKENGIDISESPKKKKRRNPVKKYKATKEKRKTLKQEKMKVQRHQPTEEFLAQVSLVSKQLEQLRVKVNEIKIKQGIMFTAPVYVDEDMAELDRMSDIVYKDCYAIQAGIKSLEHFTMAAGGARRKICYMQAEHLVSQLKNIMDNFRLMQTGYVEKRKREYREKWIKHGTGEYHREEEKENVEEKGLDSQKVDQNGNNKKKGKLKIIKSLSFKRSNSESDTALKTDTLNKRKLQDIVESETTDKLGMKDENEKVEKRDKSMFSRFTLKRRSSRKYSDGDNKRNSSNKDKLTEEGDSAEEDIDLAFKRYSMVSADLNDVEDTGTLKRDKSRLSWRLSLRRKSKSPAEDKPELERSLKSESENGNMNQTRPASENNDNNTIEIEVMENESDLERSGRQSISESDFEASIEDTSTPNKNWSRKEKIPILSSLRKGKFKWTKKTESSKQEIIDGGQSLNGSTDSESAQKSGDLSKEIEIIECVEARVDKTADDIEISSENKTCDSLEGMSKPSHSNCEVVLEKTEIDDTEVESTNKNWLRGEKMKIPLLSSLRKPKLKKSEKLEKEQLRTSDLDHNKDNAENKSTVTISSGDKNVCSYKLNEINEAGARDEAIEVTVVVERNKSLTDDTENKTLAVEMITETETTTTKKRKMFSKNIIFKFRKKKSSDLENESKMIPLLEQASEVNKTTSCDEEVPLNKVEKIEDVPEVIFKSGGNIVKENHNIKLYANCNSESGPCNSHAKQSDIIVENTDSKIKNKTIKAKFQNLPFRKTQSLSSPDNPEIQTLLSEKETRGENPFIEDESLDQQEVHGTSSEGNTFLSDQETEKSQKDLEAIQKREERLRNLENNIFSLNQLQKEIYSIVESGDEQINRIQYYVDEAEYNIEEGQEELKKARKWTKRLRTKKFIFGLGGLALLLVVGTIILIVALA